MQSFTYTISDPLGIHARPAGLLARAAREYADTTIMLSRDNQSARTTQMMKLMALGVKQGDRITVTADGPRETEAIEAMRRFFSEHL